jgi:hypothetical protein
MKRTILPGQVATAVGPAEAPALHPDEMPAVQASEAPEKEPEMVCPGCPQKFKTREQWIAHTRNHAHARLTNRAA